MNSYLVSLETGLSFDLQSAGDAFSETAATTKKKKEIAKVLLQFYFDFMMGMILKV